MRGRTLTLTRFMADKIFKSASKRVGLEGVSTHSFRRTALTMMSSAGIPLRVIQEISGHNDLGTLQRYLEVSPEQKRSGCVCDLVLIGSALYLMSGMLAPILPISSLRKL